MRSYLESHHSHQSGEDSWKRKDMATVFRNLRWRRPLFWIMVIVHFFDITDAFCIGVATSPPNLVRIGLIIKKWQQFFEIQDGGSRHVRLRLLCAFRYHSYVVNQIRVVTFAQKFLVKFGQIVKSWHQFFEIQDGCGRHSKKYTPGRTAILRIEFQSKFQSDI